ncbi:7844_t:CDS:1, partial [Gigaspora rosea]
KNLSVRQAVTRLGQYASLNPQIHASQPESKSSFAFEHHNHPFWHDVQDLS